MSILLAELDAEIARSLDRVAALKHARDLVAGDADLDGNGPPAPAPRPAKAKKPAPAIAAKPANGAGLQRCSKCTKEQPTSEFHRNGSTPSGWSRWCKGCGRKAAAARYAAKHPKKKPSRAKKSDDEGEPVLPAKVSPPPAAPTASAAPHAPSPAAPIPRPAPAASPAEATIPVRRASPPGSKGRAGASLRFGASGSRVKPPGFSGPRKNAVQARADDRKAWLGDAIVLRCKLPDADTRGVLCGGLVTPKKATQHLWDTHRKSVPAGDPLEAYFDPCGGGQPLRRRRQRRNDRRRA